MWPVGVFGGNDIRGLDDSQCWALGPSAIGAK